MTIYEIPNIEHCDITTIASCYRILAHSGWYIYQDDNIPGIDEEGNPTKVYRNITILQENYDFSLVEITAEPDLPSNADIYISTNDDEEEVSDID